MIRLDPPALRPVFLYRWRPYAWITLLGAVVYLRTLGFGFTNLDDNLLITRNYPFLSDAGNIWRSFGQRVFAESALPYYRPLLMVSFIVDAQIGGLSPVVYHAHNLLAHLGVSCLLYLFLCRFGFSSVGSLLCALAFSVHPALAQAVAWIPGRNDSLLALFVLASFVLLFAYERRAGFAAYVGHLACFAAALFTKESAVFVPFLAAYYVTVIKKRRPLSRGMSALWIGYAAALICWAVMRAHACRGAFELSWYDGLRFFGMYAPAVVQLIGKAFMPVGLSVFPTMQNTPLLYGCVAIPALAVYAMARKPIRYDRLFFGLAWFMAFLVPSLVRPHAGAANDVLEHRLYVPFAGLCVALLAIGVPGRFKKAVYVISAVLIPVFAALAFRHSGDFRDQFSYWENAVATSPDSPFAHLLLGIAYFDDDEVAPAERELAKAIALDHQLRRAHYYLGLTYMKKMMYSRAEDEFRKEIALYPEFDAAYGALAVARYKQGRHDGVEELWRQALALNPDNVEACRNLAIYYRERGDLAAAKRCVEELAARGIAVPADFLQSLQSP